MSADSVDIRLTQSVFFIRLTTSTSIKSKEKQCKLVEFFVSYISRLKSITVNNLLEIKIDIFE